MSEKSTREIMDRYTRAVIEQDLDTQDKLRHPDYVAEWPQSGERVRGPANARAIADHWPGGLAQTGTGKVHGSEDRWVTTPVGTLLRITGTGDVYTSLFTAVYPGDLRTWHLMAITEFRDGKVLKDTLVFGAPFEAPAWRAQWVERIPGPS